MHVSGMIFDEKDRPDKIEIEKLVTRYLGTRKIPLREILPLLKGKSFIVTNVGGKKITAEGIERVIKEMVPHAVVHHVISSRDERSGATKTSLPQKGLSPGDPVPALALRINENDDIFSFCNWFLPPMIKFTL